MLVLWHYLISVSWSVFQCCSRDLKVYLLLKNREHSQVVLIYELTIKMNRFKVITFDITDTILKFRGKPSEKYAEIGSKYGLCADPEELAVHFKNNYRHMTLAHPNFGRTTGIGWMQWWNSLVTKTFRDTGKFDHVDDAKFEEIGTKLINMYKTPECWTVAEGAKDLLSYLNKNNVPVGVISNFDERLVCILRAMDVSSHFRFVLASYSVGFEKPDERIFKLALKRFGNLCALPHEALHVGNSVEKDYFGAQNAGWSAAVIHEEPCKLREKYKTVAPNDIFKDLKELRLFLDS